MDAARIHRLRDLYAQVETRLKTIEYNAGGNLSIPCVNQLRYVGNHLLEYLTSNNEAHLAEAESHGYRALFDSYEVEALYYLRMLQELQEEYEDLTITDCVSDYLDWCRIAQDARNFVRQHSQSNGRGAYYQAFEVHVNALQGIHTLLPHARGELNKKRRQGAIGTRWAWIGVILGVVGIAFGIFAWVEPDMGKEILAKLFGSNPATHVATHTTR